MEIVQSAGCDDMSSRVLESGRSLTRACVIAVGVKICSGVRICDDTTVQLATHTEVTDSTVRELLSD